MDLMRASTGNDTPDAMNIRHEHPAAAADNSEPVNGRASARRIEAASMEDSVRLPQAFIVKYLGKRNTDKLWGIRHTRRPVDDMVAAAKALEPGSCLPLLQLLVSERGISVAEMKQNVNRNFEAGHYPVDRVSYGVQDVLYTRVFAMIVVRDGGRQTAPLECHAFVCDRRESARRLTFSLAAAFQRFGSQAGPAQQPVRPAIDLRSPEQIQAEMRGSGNDPDSEA